MAKNRREAGRGRRRVRKIIFLTPEGAWTCAPSVYRKGLPPQLSPEQEVKLAAVEAAHGGMVPMSREELVAIRRWDVGAMRRLAERPGSALRFIFNHDWASGGEPPRLQLLPVPRVPHPVQEVVVPRTEGEFCPVPPTAPRRVLAIHMVRAVPAFRKEGGRFVLNLPPGVAPDAG